MTDTTTRNSLELPLYASKPQRRIPGTNVVAVTMYRSGDKTVQRVALFTEDGLVSLGTVHYQHRHTMTRSRGWSIHSCPRVDQYRDQWPTLAEAAAALAERLGCSDKIEAR